MDTLLPAPNLHLLLDHFAAIPDRWQRCKVMFPVREVLLLFVCGTIASSISAFPGLTGWGW